MLYRHLDSFTHTHTMQTHRDYANILFQHYFFSLAQTHFLPCTHISLHTHAQAHTHTGSFTPSFPTNLHPNSLCTEHTHFLRHVFCIPSHKHTQLHPDSHFSTHTFNHLRNTDAHPHTHTFLHICTSSVDPNMLLRQATSQSLLPYPPLSPKGVYPSMRTLYTQG